MLDDDGQVVARAMVVRTGTQGGQVARAGIVALRADLEVAGGHHFAVAQMPGDVVVELLVGLSRSCRHCLAVQLPAARIDVSVT